MCISCHVCNGWDVTSDDADSACGSGAAEGAKRCPPTSGPSGLSTASASAADERAVPERVAAASAAAWDVSDSESAAAASPVVASASPFQAEMIPEVPPIGPRDEHYKELASCKPRDVPEGFWFLIVWTFMLPFRIARFIICEGILPGVNRDLLCAGTCPEIYGDMAFFVC